MLFTTATILFNDQNVDTSMKHDRSMMINSWVKFYEDFTAILASAPETRLSDKF